MRCALRITIYEESESLIIFAYLIITYLRQYSGGELRFELNGISLVVNLWFDVIYREKTGCNRV